VDPPSNPRRNHALTRASKHGATRAPIISAMADDEDITLPLRRISQRGCESTLESARRKAHVTARLEPTSWNGVSYDDVMRSLEDALPPSHRRTIVDQHRAPTRPAFEPVPVTKRMPWLPTAELLTKRTPLYKPTSISEGVLVPSVVPVAMPVEPVERDPGERPSRRSRSSRFVLGAALGMSIVFGFYAYAMPDVRSSLQTSASDARARVTTFLESSNESPAAATPPPPAAPAVAPIAAPETVSEDAPAIPEMRAPTPPPPLKMRPVKPKPVDTSDVAPTE
jgi:hypothetical protein